MTSKERERKFDSGYCTRPKCRTFVKVGDGVQVVRSDQSIDRFCFKHYRESLLETSETLGRLLRAEYE